MAKKTQGQGHGSSAVQAPEADDPLAKALGPSGLEAFVEENKNLLLIGIVALVALVSAFIFFRGSSEAKMSEAGLAYAQAESVDDFDKVMKEFPGTIVEGNAMIRKAALLEEDGKIDEAKMTLTEFRKRFPKHPRYDQATSALGQLAENSGEVELAESYYAQVKNTSEFYPYAQIHLGDLAMQKKEYENARLIYNSVQSHFAQTAWKGQWDDRMERVERHLKLAENPAKAPKLPPASKTEPEAPEEDGAEEADTAAPTDEAQPGDDSN